MSACVILSSVHRIMDAFTEFSKSSPVWLETGHLHMQLLCKSSGARRNLPGGFKRALSTATSNRRGFGIRSPAQLVQGMSSAIEQGPITKKSRRAAGGQKESLMCSLTTARDTQMYNIWNTHLSIQTLGRIVTCSSSRGWSDLCNLICGRASDHRFERLRHQRVKGYFYCPPCFEVRLRKCGGTIKHLSTCMDAVDTSFKKVLTAAHSDCMSDVAWWGPPLVD